MANISDEISIPAFDKVFASINIPPRPGIVTRVMQETQHESPDLLTISSLIAADVGMAAFSIKLANSPYFRRGEITDSVTQAIVRLGTRNISCAVVAAALRASSMSEGLDADFLETFWNRSSCTASTAGMIARKLHGISPDSAYTHALFHDAAIPIMIRRFDDYMNLFSHRSTNEPFLPALEAERYQCTHAIVGALLAHNWLLPRNIIKSIRHHHDRSVYDLDLAFLSDEERTLIATTHVAEHLLSDIFNEPDDEVSALSELACSYLGLHSEDIQEFRDVLRENLN